MGKKVTTVLLFVLVVAAAAGLTVYVGQDAPGMMIYNFVFLGIMVILFLVGMIGGMFRVLNIADAFQNGLENLGSAFRSKGKAEMKRIQLLTGIFGNAYLDEKIDSFVTAVNNSQEGIVEVEDYLNEDDIDNHVHKRMLEMFSDIFTSLGILGTFVGLVWGLKNFSPNDYETMTNSVASLVEGIKVAFLTSIYGVSLSIVYNYGMRAAFSDMGEKIQNFLSAFHEVVLPTAENESRNLLLSNAKQQNEIMSEMSEKVAKEMAENFERAISPVFDKMSTSLDALSEAAAGPAEKVIEDICDAFLREMNKTFRIQLSNFDGALEDLKKVQLNTTEYTEALYKNLSRELSDSYSKQERLMKGAVRDLVNSMDNYTRTAAEMSNENMETQKQTRVDYEHILTYLKQAEKTSGDYWMACNQTMQKYVEMAAESTEKVGNAGKVSAAVIRENRGILQTLDERIQKYAMQEQESMRTMAEVKRLLSDMMVDRQGNDVYISSGNISKNRDYERLQRTITEQGERQEELLRELIDSVKELNRSKKSRFFS
ncbi:MAG: MotA/TolQ/ExbB proton channel family protein [Clostridiales bacterium]|nr:MotA/TolQ/ExbB proton channel family protein [Candidatus Blautia equi]